MLKARFLFVSLKWAAKVTVKELFTNLDRFGCGSSSVVSSGRKVLNCSLPLDEFGTSCCFPQGGESSIVFVVAARPLWNVVPFSSGRKDLVYYCSTGRLVWLPATRRIWNVVLFSQGKIFFYLCCCRRSTNLERRAVYWLCLPLTVRLNVVLISRHSTSWNFVLVFSERKEFPCESSLNWTPCLISSCSTSLVSRAVFTGRKFVYLCCCHRSMTLGRRVKYFPPPYKFGRAWNEYLHLINKYVCEITTYSR